MIQRIVFVSIFHEGKGGGEGRVAYEMARWFSHHKKVVMLCPGNSTGLQVDSDGFTKFTLQSTNEGDLAVPLLSLPNIRRLFRYLDELKPDVVHIHDPAMLGVVAQLWAKANHVPVFYTAHIIPSRALDFGASEVAKFLSSPITEGLVEKYLLNFYQNCDAVVSLNETAKQEILDFGYTGSILDIPNGRNLSQFHACQFADPSSVEKILTFVGFINKRKNQTFLIEAMRYLPHNYRLVLIGEPLVPAYQEELVQMAKDLGVQVTFTGQLEQPEVIAALEKTLVFVSASKMEVQSLVIIEALASGTPVVGLSNETIAELVDSSNGIRMPSDTSTQEFAAAVLQIAELHEDDYWKLCQNARNRVQDMDWSNVMVKTLQSYMEIRTLKERTPPPRISTEVLRKYVGHIPVGKLQSILLEALSSVSLPERGRSALNAKILWITLLNMAGSVAGYYLLKGSICFIRNLHKGKDR
jgi:1,2-diacylglycerol 3-alpha-glucosyltransferase